MFHIANLSTDGWFYKGGKCGCFVLINKLHSWGGQSALCAICIQSNKSKMHLRFFYIQSGSIGISY